MMMKLEVMVGVELVEVEVVDVDVEMVEEEVVEVEVLLMGEGDWGSVEGGVILGEYVIVL